MSITSRITSIEGHITDAYNGLAGLGADLTGIDKNIDNIAQVLDNIYDDLPKVTGSGTSITLDDTRVGKIKSTLKGNTSQTGTPTPTSPIPVNVVSGDNEINVCGKNLFKPFEHTDNNTGLTLEIVNGNVHLYGTATSNNSFRIMNDVILNGTYTWSLEGNISLWAWNRTTSSADVQISQNANEVTKTYNGDNTIIMAFTPVTGTTYDITFKPMLEKGTQHTTYEPYQGDTYNIDLPVENLLPFQNQDFTINNVRYYCNNGNLYFNGTSTGETSRKNQSFKDNFAFYLNAGTYTFKQNILDSGNASNFGKTIAKYSDDTSLAYINNSTTQVSFTLTERTQVYLGFYIYQKTFSDETFNFQLEKGSKANSYTPYGTTPIELCKIGNYQDYFYKDSGKWYLHKEIGKVVLNGSENWSKSSAYSTSTYFAGFTTVVNNLIKQNSYNVICDNFTLGSYISVRDNECIANNEKTLNIQILASRLSENTADALKAWLSTHNTEVYYILATPTNTEITYQPLIDQLNLLEKAMSKDGQTNISQVNNDLPFIISASALKEWQENTSLNSTLSMVNPLSLGNTLNTQEIENNTQPIEVDNIEPLEEEEYEES